MTVGEFETLFDYGYWANRKLFDVLAELTDEEFTQPVAGSYGSVRNTLVHAVGADPKHTSLLGDLLRHAAIHGVHHRGQVALLLRLLGHAPGNFDILFYYERAQAERQA